MKKLEINIITCFVGLVVFSTTLLLFLFGIRIVKALEFEKNCTAYIYRAENAPTAEEAAEQLSIAIEAMEQHGFTSGQILGVFEVEDPIGYCYNSLKSFKSEFDNFNVSTEAEVYNVELNALQSRLKTNEPPYLISMGSVFLRWFYIITIIAWLTTLALYYWADSCYLDTDVWTIKIPTKS